MQRERSIEPSCSLDNGKLPVRESSLPEHISAFDGMRGLAVLIITLNHVFIGSLGEHLSATTQFIVKMVDNQWVFLDFFFIISGFLIFRMLLRARHREHYTSVFYLRRAARVLPMYFVLLFIFLICYLGYQEFKIAILKKTLAEPVKLWSYFCFVQNYLMGIRGDYGALALAATWSLAVEEQFYLVAPWVIRCIRNDRLLVCFFSSLICLSVVARWSIAFNFTSSIPLLFAYTAGVCRMDTICLGGLLAYLSETSSIYVFEKYKKYLLVLSLILFIHLYYYPTHPIKVVFGLSASCLLIGSLILYVLLSPDSWLTKFFNFSLLRQLGNISFGIFLFHNLINGLAHALILKSSPLIETPTQALVSVLGIGATILISWLSSKYYEVPVRKYIKTLTEKPDWNLRKIFFSAPKVLKQPTPA